MRFANRLERVPQPRVDSLWPGFRVQHVADVDRGLDDRNHVGSVPEIENPATRERAAAQRIAVPISQVPGLALFALSDFARFARVVVAAMKDREVVEVPSIEGRVVCWRRWVVF